LPWNKERRREERSSFVLPIPLPLFPPKQQLLARAVATAFPAATEDAKDVGKVVGI
jgi:hypothetical protein